ncbi:hypothetical protein B0O80DRAFT_471985 [Mortierella sp. GBAus27b]|nr:hypothetical protein B0O80DRAFT_471985 [Mortierella sp. GBAus27b]
MDHQQDLITDDIRGLFHRDGFVIVQNALTSHELEVFRQEVDSLVNFIISEDMDIMKDYGGIIEPISCGYIDPPASQKYILSKRSYSTLRNMVTEEPNSVVPVLLDKMPAMAQKLLPMETEDNPLCLFNEQYIVKTPNSASTSSFPWHWDSQYMDPLTREAFPIVSCWTALDDVNTSNGALLIEPYPRAVDALKHEYLDVPHSMETLETYLDYHTGMASGYGPEHNVDDALAQAMQGPLNSTSGTPHRDPGHIAVHDRAPRIHGSQASWKNSVLFERQRPVLVDIPAGSIVFLSGFVRHCSVGNRSLKFRRAYMPQFSLGKVVGEDGCMVSLGVPCSDSNSSQGQ